MDDSLERLQKNNEVPSPTLITLIQGLLLEPRHKLLENEAEVARLDALMQDLKREQSNLRHFIQTHDVILAPIRKLPAELLGEIFYHCLPTERYASLSSSEAPLLLTRICRSWREIVIAQAPIWAKIHIPLPILTLRTPGIHEADIDIYPAVKAEAARLTTEACQTRLELLKIWLDRSGQCPLSISVVSHERAIISADDRYASGILKAIVKNAYRWKELTVFVSDPIYNQIYKLLAAHLSPNVLRSLTSFRLHCTGTRNTLSRVLQPEASPPYDVGLVLRVLEKTTDLKSLAVSVDTNWCIRMIPSHVFKNLSHLDLSSGMYDVELAPILLQCGNLVECKLSITKGPPSTIQIPTTIPLPHLRKLVIIDTGSEDITESVFKAIDAPVLKSVEYAKPKPRQRPFMVHPQAPPPVPAPASAHDPSIFALLAVAPLVEHLGMNYLGVDQRSIHRCLETARHTRRLVVGSQLAPIYNNPLTQSSIHNRTEEPINLKELTVQPRSPGPHSDILLPHLEELEAHQILNFSDEDLLQMIKSRLDASRNGQVAPLKSVTISFLRGKERDIKEEALQYAREVGIDFKLELVYMERKQIPSGYLPILSPRFGLSEDGRRLSALSDMSSLYSTFM